MSPQLLKDGAGEEIADRYGKLAGTIGEDGLGVPDERVVRRRPPRGTTLEGAEPVHEFTGLGRGKGLAGGRGEPDNIFSWREFSHCVLVLVVPALVLLHVGNGLGVEESKRRDVLLSVLGAGPAQRLWGRAGDVTGPVLTGILLAVAGLGAVIRTGPRLPVTGFIVPGHYLTEHWPVMLAAPVAAGAVTVMLSVLVPRAAEGRHHPPPGGERTRSSGQAPGLPRGPGDSGAPARRPGARPPSWSGAGPDVSDRGHGHLRDPADRPGSAGGGRRGGGGGLGRLRGSTAALIGGRRLAAAPSGTARTVAGTVVLVGILLQANVELLTRFEAADRATRQTLRNSALVMEVANEDREEISRFLGALPGGLGALTLQDSAAPDPDITRRSVVLTGECQDLRALGSSCRGGQDLSALPTRTRTLLAQLYLGEPDRVDVRAGPAESVHTDDFRTLLISDPSGRAADLPRIKRIAYRTVPFVPQLYDLGEGGFGTGYEHGAPVDADGSVRDRDGPDMGASLGVTAVTRFREQADDLGPVSVLTGRRTPFWGIGAWTVAVPLALGAWTSLAVSWIVIAPLTGVPDGPTLSGTLQIVLPGALTAIALITWVYVSVNTVRSLRDWGPRNA